MAKDIYRFCSRKKLKNEINLLKDTFNGLFDNYKQLQSDYHILLLDKLKVQRTLSDVRTKNRNLTKENNKLKKEEQILYDCIEKWYEPTNEKKMIKLIKETKKVFESFMQNV